MATVTPQMVKELREATGAGMSDCKKALDQTEGNMDNAVTFLREKGLAAAAKKASRAASEGVVSAIVQGDTGYLVEINCETDFVTRNEEFQELVASTSQIISSKKPADLATLLSQVLPDGKALNDKVTGLVAKIGENITIRRYSIVTGPKNTMVASYVHAGGKVGVLVQLAGDKVEGTHPALQEIGRDVALQVAAMKPLYLNRESVSAEIVKSESEIFYQQYKNQGKPEAALPKIVASRMDTWHKESCLTEQMFVKDDGKTIAAYVAEAGKKAGIANLTVSKFERMELGAGVEKKSDDFAAEVAAQIAAASK